MCDIKLIWSCQIRNKINKEISRAKFLMEPERKNYMKLLAFWIISKDLQKN